uniref:Uncharacterized protein n=1 Tax=Arundo donax TaxID=35708 RepID=A0A0A9CA56_ARUDO
MHVAGGKPLLTSLSQSREIFFF